MTNDQIGMLLVGHGTRDEQGVAEFLETAAMVGALVPEVAVEPAFLEVASPAIDVAMQRLVTREVREIVVVPLLLFAAGHVKQDIPKAVRTAAAPYTELNIRYAEPLGCHPQILAASAERYLEAQGERSSGVGDDVALVIISRGTSDPQAIQSVRQFVAARRDLTPVAEAYLGFMAVAEPSVDDAIRAAQLSDHRRIVVQPHLLFHGKVLIELQERVSRLNLDESMQRLLLAAHLGPCRQVAEAAFERFLATSVMNSGNSGLLDI